jgi:hypothetical protein
VFGRLAPDTTLRFGENVLNLGLNDDTLVYERGTGGRSLVSKTIAGSDGMVFAHPVEPLRLPEEVARHIEIVFDPIIVEAGREQTVYLLFPFDIGVFVQGSSGSEVIDLFSLTSPKFSLYGPVNCGVITRWHRSPLFFDLPSADPLREGILRLTIRNQTRDWAELGRVVFDCGGVKLWFGDRVGMVASMRILRTNHAETEVRDEPLMRDWVRAIELLPSKRIPGLSRPSCSMETGYR